jgi:hypothetical protein
MVRHTGAGRHQQAVVIPAKAGIQLYKQAFAFGLAAEILNGRSRHRQRTAMVRHTGAGRHQQAVVIPAKAGIQLYKQAFARDFAAEARSFSLLVLKKRTQKK